VNDWAEGIAQIVRSYIDDQVVQLRAENLTLRASLAETQAKLAARVSDLESQDNLADFVDHVARELSHG
jgi:cell division protein FtsB